MISKETLAEGNLLNDKILEKLQEYLSGFNSFLMLIKSDLDKTFGYFIPSDLNFGDKDFLITEKQLALYWINGNNELVTCVSKSL